MQQHNEVELSALGMGAYIIQIPITFFIPFLFSNFIQCYLFKNIFLRKKNLHDSGK
jgi:hypothetical protein